MSSNLTGAFGEKMTDQEWKDVVDRLLQADLIMLYDFAKSMNENTLNKSLFTYLTERLLKGKQGDDNEKGNYSSN